MSVSTYSPVPDAADVPVDRFYRLSTEQFRRMTEAGILDEGEPVELREGRLVGRDSRADSTADRSYHLTVDQYHRMDEAGIITTSDRIELLGGWLVTKMPNHPPHRWATRKARVALERILPPGW